jgi:hypothetical protein
VTFPGRSLSRNLVLTAILLGLLVVGAAVAVYTSRSSQADISTPLTETHVRSSCSRSGLSAVQLQNCELIGSPDGFVRLLGEPDVRGMRFQDAHDLMVRKRIDFEFVRAYERELSILDWVVCYQGKGRNWDSDPVVYTLRLVLTITCPQTLPTVAEKKRVGEVTRQLDVMHVRYTYLDAADDDFTEAPDRPVTASWVVCSGDLGSAIEGWLSGHGSTLHDNGDAILVDLHVAPGIPGCSASNEAEEQGEGGG